MQVNPSQDNKDIVIYTAIFNDYDTLLSPTQIEDNIDYICFTDNPSSIPDPWEAHRVDDSIESPQIKSREFKMLPHKYFSSYDYSIWIDGNIHIRGDMCEIIDEYLNGVNMALPSHPKRNCIYEEAQECIKLGKSNPNNTRAQMKKYRRRGFPTEYGLSWACILIRKHMESDVIRTMEAWWEEFQSETKRDQLSFEFVAWLTDFDYRHIDTDIDSNSGIFSRHNHKPSGTIGHLWARLIRNRGNSTGNIAVIYHIAASILYYCHKTREIYTENELMILVNNVIAWLKNRISSLNFFHLGL